MDVNGQLIVIGAGEHARVIMDSAREAGWTLVGYIAPTGNPECTARFRVPHLGTDADIQTIGAAHPQAKFVIGVGVNSIRKRIAESLHLPPAAWATIRHPSAVVSQQSELGPGTVCLARAVVQSGVVTGAHCVINSGCIVEHDCQLGDFCHLGPGCILGGRVIVGADTLVGMGARVRDHLQVGDHVTVGAGSVVIVNVPDGETVVGIPATRLRPQANIAIDGICLPLTASLFDAMSMMSGTGSTIALITDENRRLCGTLTDGDIRRALVAHKSFDEPAAGSMRREFISVRGEDVSHAQALDIMRANDIGQLPILDHEGRISRMHTLRGVVDTQRALDVTTVIMAGGLGTRLHPITTQLPKPMVRVAGRPILEHILFHLVGNRIQDVHLAINHLGAMIETHFGNGSHFGCRLHYLREDRPLGTGGPLRLLPPELRRPESTLLVMNGDLITQVNVRRMLDEHLAQGNLITMGIRNYEITIPYGVVELQDQRIVSVVEKPTQLFPVNAGIYMISGALVDRIPADQPFPITALVEDCLGRGERVGSYEVDGDWIDVGMHQQLAQARGL